MITISEAIDKLWIVKIECVHQDCKKTPVYYDFDAMGDFYCEDHVEEQIAEWERDCKDAR